jgi:hypothetical protein
MDMPEAVELCLIPLIGAVTWWLAFMLPLRIAVGKLLLWAAALLLLQSLLRDLWLITRARRRAQQGIPPRVAQCMCVESMVGMSGIVVGLMLLSFGIGKSVSMARWAWSASAILVLGLGFVMKDYVLEAKPWRLRRDKDHINIIVKWKK